MNERFLSKHHIRTQAQFQYVYTLRQRFPGRFYVLYYRRNKANHPRLGVVASNRNVSKAVIRNRVKRLAREAFRHHRLQLPTVDIVIVARSDAAVADKRELRVCLDKLFMRLLDQSEH